MTRRHTLLLFPIAALIGCGAKPQASKRYPMEGEIKGLNPATKTALIDAGKIGDWMEAMTMEYPVRPDSEFAKLKIGDRIKATVVVQEVGYYVTDVTVVSHAG
jgi:Cu/Ag efflux protein CusF